ncbi:RsmE family RNA methyltransferase [Ignavibacterium sp.]|uniref:RsmE family RNA methyltransferase n=1 Tax=Ignavibacterium sp. TaxID=2651167 RepID=UPI00307DBDEE
MTLEFLSNIELFFSEEITDKIISLRDDEYIHCVKVLRYKSGDKIFVTDGNGKIYHCTITEIHKNFLDAEILIYTVQKIKFPHIHFCIPLLRNKDRFRFAFEKLAELGISSIIIYKAERAVKEKFNLEKYRKIAIETIKQSLQANLPEIKVVQSINELNSMEGNKLIFEQNSEKRFDKNLINTSEANYFIFGPEGGLSENEINLLRDAQKFSLAENRLRTETAVIKAASILTQ